MLVATSQGLPPARVYRALQLASNERRDAMGEPDLADVLPSRVMEILATATSAQNISVFRVPAAHLSDTHLIDESISPCASRYGEA